MIKISEDFECEEDRYQWILHEWYDGKDKDGKPVRQRRTTYPGSLYQCINAVISKKAGKCESLEELKTMLKKAVAFELVRVLDLPDIPKPNKRTD